MPKVSVIITSYNYGNYINKCIESCLCQCSVKKEIIVVDDHSTDNTRDILNRHYKEGHIRFVISKENRGYSACKNAGIAVSKGEYVTFIDADDILCQSSLECRVKILDENPDIDVVHGSVKILRDDSGYIRAMHQAHKLRTHPSYVNAQGVMLRRRVFEKYGLFYEPLRSKADKEYWQRIGLYKSCNKPYESIQPDPVKSKKIKNIVAFYRKHNNSMRDMRKRTPEYEAEVNRIFDERREQIKREGITRENTQWL